MRIYFRKSTCLAALRALRDSVPYPLSPKALTTATLSTPEYTCAQNFSLFRRTGRFVAIPLGKAN